jgi:MerR family transcriptional regulator, light-induced transcriptional regulator
MAGARQFAQTQFGQTVSDWGSIDSGSTTIDQERRPARMKSNKPNTNKSGGAHKKSALDRTIEGEIIPRLMLAHGSYGYGGAKIRADDEILPAPFEVVEFARLAMMQPVNVGFAYLEALRVRGATLETLFLDLIGPAARHLGYLWKNDLCDFVDVTVGLNRLQQMVRELSPAFESETEHRSSTRRAILVPAPGEQHGLGLSMVQEFFRRSGWHVHPVTPQSVDELKSIVRRERFDVIGFSLSCEACLPALASTIQTVRKVSKNQAAGIMAGGRVFNENPELVARVGADATAIDGRQAVLRLPALLGLKATSC